MAKINRGIDASMMIYIKMNNEKYDQILKERLNINMLDPKKCKFAVEAFRCCSDIKGPENCEEFIDFTVACYKNLGRLLNNSYYP